MPQSQGKQPSGVSTLMIGLNIVAYNKVSWRILSSLEISLSLIYLLDMWSHQRFIHTLLCLMEVPLLDHLIEWNKGFPFLLLFIFIKSVIESAPHVIRLEFREHYRRIESSISWMILLLFLLGAVLVFHIFHLSVE